MTTSVQPPSAQFGEDGARLTYGSYLRLDQLLDQQRLASDAHDELLFITVHQVYELWFKLLLFEVESARAAMTDGQLWWARHLLARVHEIERILIEQIGVLETMTPQDFLEFRAQLAPASGFQSVQFRELEFLSGAKDPKYVDRFRGLTEAERTRLQRRLTEPTLWEAFISVLEKSGLPAGNDDEVSSSMRVVAQDRATYGEIWELAEALLVHDERAAAWRARHIMMVERMIGTKTGTGGSAGAEYLRSRLDLRYYPVLWELRSWL